MKASKVQTKEEYSDSREVASRSGVYTYIEESTIKKIDGIRTGAASNARRQICALLKGDKLFSVNFSEQDQQKFATRILETKNKNNSFLAIASDFIKENIIQMRRSGSIENLVSERL